MLFRSVQIEGRLEHDTLQRLDPRHSDLGQAGRELGGRDINNDTVEGKTLRLVNCHSVSNGQRELHTLASCIVAKEDFVKPDVQYLRSQKKPSHKCESIQPVQDRGIPNLTTGWSMPRLVIVEERHKLKTLQVIVTLDFREQV